MRWRRRRGFTMVVAVVLLAFATAALATLVARGRFDARRTVAARSEAQLRLLLLAGAADVPGHGVEWGEAVPDERWAMPVPADLRTARVDLYARPTGGGAGVVDVTATVDGRRGTQTLHVRRDRGRWRVTGATLGGAEG